MTVLYEMGNESINRRVLACEYSKYLTLFLICNRNWLFVTVAGKLSVSYLVSNIQMEGVEAGCSIVASTLPFALTV